MKNTGSGLSFRTCQSRAKWRDWWPPLQLISGLAIDAFRTSLRKFQVDPEYTLTTSTSRTACRRRPQTCPLCNSPQTLIDNLNACPLAFNQLQKVTRVWHDSVFASDARESDITWWLRYCKVRLFWSCLGHLHSLFVTVSSYMQYKVLKLLYNALLYFNQRLPYNNFLICSTGVEMIQQCLQQHMAALALPAIVAFDSIS